MKRMEAQAPSRGEAGSKVPWLHGNRRHCLARHGYRSVRMGSSPTSHLNGEGEGGQHEQAATRTTYSGLITTPVLRLLLSPLLLLL